MTVIRVMCPVCKNWFVRTPRTRQIYDTPRCRKIGQSMIAGRKRRAAKKDADK